MALGVETLVWLDGEGNRAGAGASWAMLLKFCGVLDNERGIAGCKVRMRGLETRAWLDASARPRGIDLTEGGASAL